MYKKLTVTRNMYIVVKLVCYLVAANLVPILNTPFPQIDLLISQFENCIFYVVGPE